MGGGEDSMYPLIIKYAFMAIMNKRKLQQNITIFLGGGGVLS